MADSRSHGAILEEIAFAASAMARSHDWRTGIDDLLQRLGRLVDVSRVYLFELDPVGEGPLSHTCRHDWAADGLERLGGASRYTRELLETVDASTDDWVARRRRGEMILGHTRDLEGALRSDFELQQIKSFLSIPIQVDGAWWGHLGFDDCVRERDWGPDEVHLLQTTAALIAASVQRQRTETTLKVNDELRSAMLDVALDAIVMIDGTGLVIEFNPAAERLFGWSREDAVGQPLMTMIVPHRMRGDHQTAMERAVRLRRLRRPGFRSELTALRVDGSEFPIELTVTLIERGEGVVLAAFIRDLTERRMAEQKLVKVERERSNLARFFSPQMVDHLVAIETPLSTARTLPAAVLFVDMIGFTGFCAAHWPDEVIAMLRDLMKLLGEAVFRQGGTVDKFLGDGLMAAFGAPVAGKRDATRAALCALQILADIETWNAARMLKAQTPVAIAIGLHFGDVILGDIGTEQRLELTILGDTVNIASRVEGFCRSLGVQMLATEAIVERIRIEGTHDLAGRFRDEGLQRLRGRTEAIRLYSLPDPAGPPDPGAIS